MDFVLAFAKPLAGVEVTILGYSDASYYRKIERREDSRLGIVVLRTWGTQYGAVAHAVDFPLTNCEVWKHLLRLQKRKPHWRV
jgi:hypothetical protein